MKNFVKEIVIIGGGMVGLSIARQLIERNILKGKNILIIDKEKKLGLHSSGRNSGVIHAGLYYKPETLKARVCVNGAKRLKEWIIENKLSINNCGKIVVPQEEKLDSQLDELKTRGKKNGAEVEIIDEKQLKEKIPFARTSSGRAIWSPNTSVVNPREIIDFLESELRALNVKFIFDEKILKFKKEEKYLLTNNFKINYEYIINCAGLNADKIAHQFGVGFNYELMPFKGVYWKIKQDSEIKINTNLYPVPDLNVPFLGVHYTPSFDGSEINIGPTATLAFGRENYKKLENIDFTLSIKNLALISKMYISNKLKFRKYVQEQAFLSFFPFFLKESQKLIPSIKAKDLIFSDKVGIRSQLYNKKTQKIEDDFISINTSDSNHVLNAISPAFTSSFELADHIINTTKLN